MDPVTGTLGLGLISGGIGAASSYMNNERNVSMARETNAQNERLMRESWGREDNAIQRRTADLRAAGLSPVLAAGQGASSSSPIKLEAPQSQDWAGPAIGGAIKNTLDASMVAKTHQDMKRTAAEIGNIAANTSNTMTSELQTKQNMEQQLIMNAFSQKAINAATFKQYMEAAKTKLDAEITKIDADKAKVTGVTPSSSGTAKNVSDVANFGKTALEKLNPYAHQQDLMREYYEKMQKAKGGKK